MMEQEVAANNKASLLVHIPFLLTACQGADMSIQIDISFP